MTTPKLETDRLLLRPILADDVQSIFECWIGEAFSFQEMR